MSQHDFDLASQAGAAFRADGNAALQALASNNKGATEPATPYPCMWWSDDTSGWMKQRNQANTAWVDCFPLTGMWAAITSLLTSIFDFRGNYDASGNVWPSTGGRGAAGAVMKGDTWRVSVAGTLGGVACNVGDILTANVDTPGQSASNWSVQEGNLGYVPEDAANKSSDVNADQASTTKYATTKALYDWAVATFSRLGVKNTYTLNGDIEVWGVEASKFRRGSWDATAAGIFTLVGEPCRYTSHNAPLVAGDFTGRDDTGTCQLEAWTETGLYRKWSAVSAAAGVVPVWVEVGTSRELLTGNRTYHVNVSTGADTNNGLSSGAAFLTLQKAADVIGMLDRGIYTVTVLVADGTYAAGVTLKASPGSAGVVFTGNLYTPANVVVQGAVTGALGMPLNIGGFKLTASNALKNGGGQVSFHDMDFAGAGYQVYASDGGYIYGSGANTISASCSSHMRANIGSSVGYTSTSTITLTGTPAFSIASVYVVQGYAVFSSSVVTWSGTATGSRYAVTSMGSINVAGAGTSWLPGDAAGTGGATTGGGIYG